MASAPASAGGFGWWTPAFGKGIGTALLIWGAYWIGTTTLQWHVASLPESGPAEMGLLYFIQLAPVLFLTPFLGPLLDRVGGRPVLLGTGMFMGAAAAGGVLLGGLGLLDFGLGAALSACLGLCMALGSPAVHALIPTTVSLAGLSPAVRSVSVMQNVARLLGPMAAGALLLHVGVPFAVAVVAVLAVAGTLLLVRIPGQRPERARDAAGGLAELVSGFRIAYSIPPVRRALLLMFANSVLNLSHVSMLPSIATGVLDVGEAGFAALLAAGGVGGLLGALFPLTGMRSLRPISALFAASAAGLALLAFAGTLPLAVSVSCLVAALGVMTAISLNIHIQRSITQEVRGRVMSLFTWAWGGFLPIGGLFLGTVADHASVRTALLATSALLGAVAVANLAAPTTPSVPPTSAPPSPEK